MADGRRHRQRCAWCGEALIDDDLALMAGPARAGQALPDPRVGAFDPGAWVELDRSGGVTRLSVVTPEDPERYPSRSCMAEEASTGEAVAQASSTGGRLLEGPWSAERGG